MPFKQPPFIYVATIILFLLPASLLFSATRNTLRAPKSLALPSWRKYIVTAALLAATASTIVHLVWNISWLRCGGSPHGMGAGPGLWQSLGRLLVWSWISAAVLSLFGTWKLRALVVGWFVSMFFVFQFIYILQFD
jgi:hypothetical protein